MLIAALLIAIVAVYLIQYRIYRDRTFDGIRYDVTLSADEVFEGEDIFLHEEIANASILPLPFVKTLYYADLDLYRYFIGRTDQSVNQEIMVKRQDQQMRVMRAMIEGCQVDKLPSKGLQRYMARDLEMIMAITSIVMIVDGGKEALQKKKDIWALLRECNPEADKRIRRGIMGFCCSSPNPLLMKLSKSIYMLCQRIYGFN